MTIFGDSYVLVPCPDEVGQARVGRAVVAADRVADLDHVIRVALFLELAHVIEDLGPGGLGQRAHVQAVEPGIAAAGHPEEDLFPARRRDPIERLVAPGLEGPADPVAAVGQAGHVVRPAGEIFHSALGEGRDELQD